MLKLSIDCDFDIGDTVYCLGYADRKDTCPHCNNGWLDVKDPPVIVEAKVDSVHLNGKGEWSGNVQLSSPFTIEVKLDDGWFILPDKLFSTREEAEENINNEDFWVRR